MKARPRWGIRGKLFLLSVALMLPAAMTSAFYLEYELRSGIERRTEENLRHYANALAAMISDEGATLRAERIDALVDQIGTATEARLSVIDESGAVVGDSEVSFEGLSELDNHGTRPEIRAVFDGAPVGVATRFSTTVEDRMLYVAVPVSAGGSPGVVRASLPLEELATAVRRFRVVLFFACLLGLLVAMVMSGVASHLVSRTVGQLVDAARAASRREANGSTVDVLATDNLGNLAGSINRMTDELESVVASLAEERDRFRAVLEGMSEAVVALGPERVVKHVNQAAIELLGIDRDPVERSLADVVRVPSIHALVDRVLRSDVFDNVVSEECQLTTNGRRVVRVNATRVASTGGLVLVIHDVTELRRLENVRREFVANVSHELRTPVSVIRATAETLVDGALDAGPEIARGFVDAILRNSERLTRLISDLLDISKIDSGHYQTRIVATDIEAVVRKAHQSIDLPENTHQVTLAFEADVTAMSDAAALEQVFVNLIENAIKYTPPGSRVDVTAAVEDANVIVRVADNGPGVDARHRDRLFERFYRVDAGRSREKGGTGLGLSIVKNLVQSMGGTVGVSANEPRGCVFWVSLPRPSTGAGS